MICELAGQSSEGKRKKMSDLADLAEIAAAAGIAIIDENTGYDAHVKDEGDAKNRCIINQNSLDDCSILEQIQQWDAMFADRYTLADPEYARNMEVAEALNRPPCVTGFTSWRQRNDSRNWNRDRHRYDGGDRGGYRTRGGHRGGWNRRDGEGGGSGGRDWGDRSHHHPLNYGDYPQNRENRDSFHYRGDGNYQNRGGYRSNWSRSRGDNYQSRRYEESNQGGYGNHRNKSEGEGRERSPQR